MVSVKKGDIVRMEYTGRIASTGQVFDTTDEPLARQAGIFEESSNYGPKLAIFGQNAIMRGMEEAIAASQLGKKGEFLITPGKAFGEKIAELIRVLSEKEFAKQSVQPVPGMMLTLDGRPAKIKSVTSGRVVVDFNHPLAGEPVLYSINVLEVISDPKKKIEAILSSLGIAAGISQKGEKFSVSFSKSESREKIESAKRAISAAVPGAEFAVQ